MAIDFSKIPSPCYVIEENRLRNNLALIKEVKERSGAEIILAFKGFANQFQLLTAHVRWREKNTWRLGFHKLYRLFKLFFPLPPARLCFPGAWFVPKIRALWLRRWRLFLHVETP